MTYSRYIIENPFFWIWLAGICGGGALASTVRLLQSTKPRIRNRYVTYIMLYLSGMVLLATAAVFFPVATRILDLRILYLFLVVAALAALVNYFPLSVGLPLILTVLVLSAMAFLATLPLQPQREERDIARIYTQHADEQDMQLAWYAEESAIPQSIELPGNRLIVEAVIVRYSDLFFPFGTPMAYQLRRLIGVGEAGEGEYHFEAYSGLIEQISSRFLQIAGLLPGIEVELARSDPLAVTPLGSYRLELDRIGKLFLYAGN